ncbi:MAG: RDD family protein [Saccharofermentanales bacterium]|jgi:uncharacterized RDD family membrane protein YckC|nr:RDD family protein [Bacillota bacterium]
MPEHTEYGTELTPEAGQDIEQTKQTELAETSSARKQLPSGKELTWLQRLIFGNTVWQRTESPVPYPGRRFVARLLDWSIYYVIWNYLILILLRGKIMRGLLLMYLDTMGVMAIMLIAEPLLLSLVGTTPGKAVMGLVLRTDEGEKLSLKDSWRRTFQVFADGMGFNVLIFNLLNLSWARRNCAAGKALLWEQKHSYKIKSTKAWRGLAVCLLALVVLFLGLPTIYQAAQYPLHRGEITPLQYAENVNEMLVRSGNKTGFYLDADGYWHEADGDLLTDKENPVPRHEMIVKDGKVIGVKLFIRMTAAGHVNSGISQRALLVTAFVAAQPEIKMIDLSELARRLSDIKNDYELEIKGVKVVSKVSYFGYKTDDNRLIGLEDFPTRYFENEFRAYLTDQYDG